MKWTNRGSETNEKYLLYKKRIGSIPTSVWIFGAGRKGNTFAKKIKWLKEEITFCGYIDNYRNIKPDDNNTIIRLSEYVKKEGELIIVAVSCENYNSVEKQLLSAGYENGRDYVKCEEFEDYLRLSLIHERGRLLLNVVQLSLTERCTLKCKKCAHGCANVPMNAVDMSFDKVCLSIETLFSIADYVNEFYLIGGEPFLFNELAKTIALVGSKYRDRINILSITTNATIPISNELLFESQKYRVTYHISNYGRAVKNLHTKVNQLTTLLDAYSIEYTLQDENDEWTDYGFDHVYHNGDEERLIKIFDDCKTPCREIRGNHFYYCIQARASAENMDIWCGRDDYLDLKQLNDKIGKLILFEYDCGYSERGYMEMCNHCYGAEAIRHPIPAAEQVK